MSSFTNRPSRPLRLLVRLATALGDEDTVNCRSNRRRQPSTGRSPRCRASCIEAPALDGDVGGLERRGGVAAVGRWQNAHLQPWCEERGVGPPAAAPAQVPPASPSRLRFGSSRP